MDDQLKNWFDSQDWQDHELPDSHRKRFLNRLNNNDDTYAIKNKKVKTISLPIWIISAISAGIAILLMVQGIYNRNNSMTKLTPELAQSQAFFTNAIATELQTLETLETPQTERLIADTRAQLKILEYDYKQLETDLKISGYHKNIIAAMINNFQSRIELLEVTMMHIETINELKELPDEITL